MKQKKDKVMIVDDEADVCETIKSVLEKEGYKVVTASSGKECLKKIRKENYKLILLDIMMPELSGYDLLKLLRLRMDNLFPLAYISIIPQEEVNLRDIDGFIQKPFENRELIRKVNSIVKKFRYKKRKKFK